MTNEHERPIFIPSKDFSNDKDVSSFEIRTLLECIHLARRLTKGNLRVSESCLLHILYLRGWTRGVVRIPQSMLALQSGLSTNTVYRITTALEKEGLFHSKRKGNDTKVYTLTRCKLVDHAIEIFNTPSAREKLTDHFIAELNKKKGKSKMRQGQPEKDTSSEVVEVSAIEEEIEAPALVTEPIPVAAAIKAPEPAVTPSVEEPSSSCLDEESRRKLRAMLDEDPDYQPPDISNSSLEEDEEIQAMFKELAEPVPSSKDTGGPVFRAVIAKDDPLEDPETKARRRKAMVERMKEKYSKDLQVFDERPSDEDE